MARKRLPTPSPAPEPATRAGGGSALLAGLVFALVFGLLHLGYQASTGTWVEQAVVHDATVKPAAWLIRLTSPQSGAMAEGRHIRAPGGGLNIQTGCDGLEVLFLLMAGFAIAPLSLRHRLGGLALGTALIYALNQVRIVALFHAFRADHALFDSLHTTVAPTLIVLLSSLFFAGWLHLCRHRVA